MKQKNRFNNIIDLIDAFPDERECLKHFEQMRWPDGEPVCLHCGEEWKEKDGTLRLVRSK